MGLIHSLLPRNFLGLSTVKITLNDFSKLFHHGTLPHPSPLHFSRVLIPLKLAELPLRNAGHSFVFLHVSLLCQNILQTTINPWRYPSFNSKHAFATISINSEFLIPMVSLVLCPNYVFEMYVNHTSLSTASSCVLIFKELLSTNSLPVFLLQW
jgi:hypothetical protein